MNFGKIMNVVSKTTGRSGLVLKAKSPEIFLVLGTIGVVGAAVWACNSTLKAQDVIAEAKEKLDSIHTAKEGATEEKYPESDYKRDLAVAYLQTGVEFIKLYSGPVILGAISMGGIYGSHGIMKKRNLALMAAYKTVEESFSNYRKRVVSELGEDKDRAFKYGASKVEVTDMGYTDENGKKHKAETRTVDVIDPNGYSMYAKFFDEASVHWNKIPEYNLQFLKIQQNYANDLLHSRGHIFLNEIYDMLGIPRTQAGVVVGWVTDGDGNGYVDFGIFDGDNMKARDFVNGYERSILLDFNVDGVIYDLIK